MVERHSSGRARWRGRRAIGVALVAILLAGVAAVAGPAGAAEPFERWAGSNRYETAAVVVRNAFPDGAATVFLASGEKPYDALAATPAAGSLGAPVLLSASDHLPSATEAALRALRPSSVVVLGGSRAIAEDVVTRVSGATGAEVRRLAGADRYATAVQVSRFAFDAPVAEAFVVSGTGFADALAGGAAAAAVGAPILLAAPTGLSDGTGAELQRLGAAKVTVLGGVASVSDGVTDQLAAAELPYARIAGGDRFETAALVSASYFASSRVAIMAGGSKFPDALAGGAAAAALGAPLLLSPRTCLPDRVDGELARLEIERLVVLGGTAALSGDAGARSSCAPAPCAVPPSTATATPPAEKDESVALSLTEVVREPSGGVPVTYRSDGPVSDAAIDFVHGAIVSARCAAGDAGGINVYLWTDLDNMYDAYIAFHSIDESQRAAYESIRTQGRNFGELGSLWLDASRGGSAGGGAATYTIVHEYLHVAQNHRARDLLEERSRVARSLGPIWLSEGNATRSGIRITKGLVPSYSHTANYMGTGMDIHEVAATHPLSLQGIERDEGWWGDGWPREAQSYAKSYVAFERLEELFGTHAVDVVLWDNMNVHVDWRDAFEATFGVTAEQWYAYFDHGTPLPR